MTRSQFVAIGDHQTSLSPLLSVLNVRVEAIPKPFSRALCCSHYKYSFFPQSSWRRNFTSFMHMRTNIISLLSWTRY